MSKICQSLDPQLLSLCDIIQVSTHATNWAKCFGHQSSLRGSDQRQHLQVWEMKVPQGHWCPRITQSVTELRSFPHLINARQEFSFDLNALPCSGFFKKNSKCNRTLPFTKNYATYLYIWEGLSLKFQSGNESGDFAEENYFVFNALLWISHDVFMAHCHSINNWHYQMCTLSSSWAACKLSLEDVKNWNLYFCPWIWDQQEFLYFTSHQLPASQWASSGWMPSGPPLTPPRPSWELWSPHCLVTLLPLFIAAPEGGAFHLRHFLLSCEPQASGGEGREQLRQMPVQPYFKIWDKLWGSPQHNIWLCAIEARTETIPEWKTWPMWSSCSERLWDGVPCELSTEKALSPGSQWRFVKQVETKEDKELLWL